MKTLSNMVLNWALSFLGSRTLTPPILMGLDVKSHFWVVFSRRTLCVKVCQSVYFLVRETEAPPAVAWAGKEVVKGSPLLPRLHLPQTWRLSSPRCGRKRSRRAV